MDEILICTRKGLLNGRTYLWYGTDLLVIEADLCEEQRDAAVGQAFAELYAASRHRQSVPAPRAPRTSAATTVTVVRSVTRMLTLRR